MSGAGRITLGCEQSLRLRYRAAVAALEEEERRVFELHRFQMHSLAQIASDLDLPVETIECLLAASLVSLARALGPNAFE